ncbi:hypothetical protein [[Clostridium] symbiosum]|uniref:hypothetical protein n=1 Tax=Clostridium symbiosum TaxID=1512 RepID=UPI00189A62C9|nr:hypothetical protein [[Clostridium] symbiosum]
MRKNIAKGFSYIALICSVFPLISYLLAMFKVTLSSSMQTVLAGMNVLCVLLGLGFSIACVKSSETRNTINIISTIISLLWVLMIVGILGLALTLSFIR